jgi:hypothetical protein
MNDEPAKPLDGGKEFRDLLGKLSQVPKKELDSRIRREKKAKAKRKKPKQ